MSLNIGATERVVRVVLGVAILSLTVIGPESPWAYRGIIPILTGLSGWCPLYSVLGISTRRKVAQ